MANPNIVNVSSIYGECVGWNLTNTLTTTLLTVAADVVIKLNFIQCANVDGSVGAALDLFVDKAAFTSAGATATSPATTTLFLAKSITVPASASIVILNSPLYLMETDVLKGGASASGDLDLFISYEVLNDA
jgi:hypothetical protein